MPLIHSASKEVDALRDDLSRICDVPLAALEITELGIRLEAEGSSEICWKTLGKEADAITLSKEQQLSAWEALKFHLNLPDVHAVKASFSFLPGAIVEATITFHPSTWVTPEANQ